MLKKLIHITVNKEANTGKLKFKYKTFSVSLYYSGFSVNDKCTKLGWVKSGRERDLYPS